MSYFRKILFFLTFIFFFSAGSNASVILRKIDSQHAAIIHQRNIYLEIVADSYNDFRFHYEHYMSSSNIDLTPFFKRKGFFFRRKVFLIPFDALSCSGKIKLVNRLFPDDCLESDGWHHTILYTGRNGETLWRIAKWFTGSGKFSKQIIKFNSVDPSRLRKSQKIVIPIEIVDDCFKATVKYPIKVGDLNFDRDSEGVFASYRLKKGEAIYSSIVLKYTARVTQSEVMNAAKIILDRSQLDSFTNIPTGATVKIPADLIDPPFLPPTDPRRIQYEKTAQNSAKFRKTTKARRLKGITIFLDAGHGGVDPGAEGPNGEKEDEYAYDVMCRVKSILEEKTLATVKTTIQDFETGYSYRNQSLLLSSQNKERILTHPNYEIKNCKVALNLRWMLVNDLFRRERKKGIDVDSFLFTSFHVDSLHPTAKGMMVYIPGADYYTGDINKIGGIYSKFRESRANPSVKLTKANRLKAEGYSMNFAQSLRASCQKKKIPMHSSHPIRKYIIRNRSAWVPAILRYIEIPTRILVELGNMRNQEDRNNLRNSDYRQKLAQIYVDSLIKYFETND